MPGASLQIDEIRSFATRQFPVSVKRLAALVRQPSHTHNIEGVTALQSKQAERFKAFGMSVTLHSMENRGPILVAETKSAVGNEQALLISAHVDSVHHADSMSHELRADGDKLFGPGAYDMKAGIVSIELAVKTLKLLGMLDTLPLRVIFNSAEEESTEQTRSFITDTSTRAIAALIFEFGRQGGGVVTSRKGILEGILKITGAGGHAGNGNCKVGSANRALVRALIELEEFEEHAAGTTFNSGKIEGGDANNIVSTHALAHFEFRSDTITGLNEVRRKVDKLKSQIESTAVQATILKQIPPMEDTAGNRSLAKAYISASNKAGNTLKILPRQGGLSDANSLGSVARIDGLGPLGDGAHKRDEYVLKSSILPRTLNLIYFLVDYHSKPS